jgi:hypothetical protein
VSGERKTRIGMIAVGLAVWIAAIVLPGVQVPMIVLASTMVAYAFYGLLTKWRIYREADQTFEAYCRERELDPGRHGERVASAWQVAVGNDVLRSAREPLGFRLREPVRPLLSTRVSALPTLHTREVPGSIPGAPT